MSAHPPPPPGTPGPYPTPPAKRPPGRFWYVVGAGLLVAAFLVFIGALLWTLWPLLQEDAVFDADGRPHRVALPAGEERAVFVRDDTIGCTATDGDGAEVRFERPTVEADVNDWTAVRTFDTGAGDVEFVCRAATEGSQVRIGALPGLAGMVGGLLTAVLVPLVLGVLGLLTLVLTAVLRSQRRRAPAR